jgi:hypothetical protein
VTSRIVRASLQLVDAILEREYRLLVERGFDVDGATGQRREPFHSWLSIARPGADDRYEMRLTLEAVGAVHFIEVTFTAPDGRQRGTPLKASVAEDELPEVLLALTRAAIGRLEVIAGPFASAGVAGA